MGWKLEISRIMSVLPESMYQAEWEWEWVRRGERAEGCCRILYHLIFWYKFLTKKGPIVHMVERFLSMEEVRGSIPLRSIFFFFFF